MKKDYVPVKDQSQVDDLRFVDNFWSERWDRYANLPSPEMVADREEFKLMEPFLSKIGAGARVLDAGCGMGEWTVYLNRLGYQTVGLDITANSIEKLQSLFPQYEFVRNDIRKTDFPGDCFDALFSWGAFEHFENGPGECLRESYRILKPGGHLFITVPFDNWRHTFMRMRSGNNNNPFETEQPASMRFYQWRFMKSEIEQELILAGFKPLWTKPVSKAEGVNRWLEWNMKMKPNTGFYNLLFKAASWLLPSDYLAHMLMAAAYKS
jgi:SAM-dependent methyltransferase